MSDQDWFEWHAPYDQPNSSLARRLALVQAEIASAVDALPPGPIRAISICAGQGRDLIGALDSHPRAGDVQARLVDLEPRNVEVAVLTAAAAGLRGVEVVCGDASHTSAFEGAVPADLVVACGIFGNISDSDIEHTIDVLPRLCAPGAIVIWTRHRKPPDVTPQIRRWFARSGFDEISFRDPPRNTFAVGSNRLAVPPQPLGPDTELFRFLDGPAADPQPDVKKRERPGGRRPPTQRGPTHRQ
jgi:hypothetical protein